MADQEKDTVVGDYRQCNYHGGMPPSYPSDNREETSTELVGPVSLKKDPYYHPSAYHVENAAEITAPVPLSHRKSYDNLNDRTHDGEGVTTGRGFGYFALGLSIISLFVMPILFGAAGIVLGFIARSKGAGGLGAWAIGIGIVSIVIGVFITPYF